MASDQRNTFDDHDVHRMLGHKTESLFKGCYSSHLYAHRSVDRHFGYDLRRYRYSDISFEIFLRCSFGVTDADMEALKDRVLNIAAHETEAYKTKSAEFLIVAGSPEARTYGLFADMGNMVLDAHQDQSGNCIKALPSDRNGRDRLAIRKPHVTLVPQKDGDTEIDLKTLRWDHMLCVVEFEKAPSDSSAEEGDLDVKNQKSASTDTRGSGADVLKTTYPTNELYPSSEAIPTAEGLQPHLPLDSSEAVSQTSLAAEPQNQDSRQAGESPTIELPFAEMLLASHITQVMSHFSGRTFTFGALVRNTKMRLAYYSRSLYVISDQIDIVKDHVMFAVFLCLFAMQPLDKLGFSKDMDRCNPFNTRSKCARKLGFDMEPVNGGDSYVLQPSMRLELGECIHIEHCLIGRATAVFDVKRPKDCKVDLVAKFQWHPKTRRREDHAILIAREVDPEHTPEIYGVAIVAEKSPSQKFKMACGSTPVLKVEERELRVILMRKYNPVEELTDEQFCEVVPQFAACAFYHYSKKCDGLTSI